MAVSSRLSNIGAGQSDRELRALVFYSGVLPKRISHHGAPT